MSSPTGAQFPRRLTIAMLAVAMLLVPSLGQLLAAEVCASRCEAATLKPVCCAAHHNADGGTPAGKNDPTHHNADQQLCPGCNGRPLIVSTDRLDLSLDRAPLVAPSVGPATPASAGVAFSIFHPPRS